MIVFKTPIIARLTARGSFEPVGRFFFLSPCVDKNTATIVSILSAIETICPSILEGSSELALSGK